MRTKLSPELHDYARRRFETTAETGASIALVCGVNESVIRRMALREGWVRFVAPPRDLPPVAKLLAQVEELETSLSLPPPSARLRASSTRYGGGEGGSGARERDGVGWGAYGVSEAPPTPDPSPPLATLAGGGEKKEPPANTEENIAHFIRVVMAHLDEFEAVRRAGKLIAREHLPTARAISILTEAFNKLQRLRAAQPGQNHDSFSDRHADTPADLDEYRLELTRQIECFLQSRFAAGVDGQSAVQPAEGV